MSAFHFAAMDANKNPPPHPRRSTVVIPPASGSSSTKNTPTASSSNKWKERNTLSNGRYSMLGNNDDDDNELQYLTADVVYASSTLRRNAAVHKVYEYVNNTKHIDTAGCTRYLIRLLNINKRKVNDKILPMTYPSWKHTQIAPLKRLYWMQDLHPDQSYYYLPIPLQRCFLRLSNHAK